MRQNGDKIYRINHDFKRALLILVIPISLQNLISATFNFGDVVMLGFINQSAMSAVSLAGQVTFILFLFYMGLSTGAGILTAQYWGKKDVRTIQRVFDIVIIFSLSISIIFFLLSMFLSEQLMRLLTSNRELVKYGSYFLRTISFSYLAMGLSQVYLSMIKSMENARLSAWISSTCLVLNLLLDTLCILILFPDDPGKAIVGVAAGTVCARFIELFCCFYHSKLYGCIQYRLPYFNLIDKNLLKDFFKFTIPVQANYIVWGFSLTVITAIIGHVSSDMVAANSIASVVKDFAIVFCGGIAGGGAVLVGKQLGNNDKEMAKLVGNKISLYAFIFGSLAGITILLLKPLVLILVDLNDTAYAYLNSMLYICAYYCIGKSLNSSIIGGIFCAGGDSKFGFWCDTVVMWGIIIPLGYLSAFVWHVTPIVLFAILSLDEIIKIPIALYRYRQYKWLNNITRNIENNQI